MKLEEAMEKYSTERPIPIMFLPNRVGKSTMLMREAVKDHWVEHGPSMLKAIEECYELIWDCGDSIESTRKEFDADSMHLAQKCALMLHALSSVCHDAQEVKGI